MFRKLNFWITITIIQWEWWILERKRNDLKICGWNRRKMYYALRISRWIRKIDKKFIRSKLCPEESNSTVKHF